MRDTISWRNDLCKKFRNSDELQQYIVSSLINADTKVQQRELNIVKDSSGSRTSGVYRWQGVCDHGERSLYLSVIKALYTERGTTILQKNKSPLDNGSRQAGRARILEIALIHHP